MTTTEALATLKPRHASFVNAIINAVREQFPTVGTLTPVCILAHANTFDTIFPDYSSPSAKEHSTHELRDKAQLLEADLVVLVIEGWGVTRPIGINLDRLGPIREQPDRQDCLIISVETIGKSVLGMALVNDSTRTLGDFEWSHDGYGPIIGILKRNA